MDKRFEKINRLLSDYSTGRFDNRLALSEKLDTTDALINTINMLGEELEAITISRNYFTNIFNSVSDMVFVLNSRGVIENVNRSGEQQLGYEPGSLTGRAFNVLHRTPFSFFYFIKKQLRNKQAVHIDESYLDRKQGGLINVCVNASRFYDAGRKMILLTASDTSFQVRAEKMVIRAIIDTQEKERQRLAKDLHDSLAQQLSAVKFYIGSIIKHIKRKTEKDILLKSNEGLAAAIADMRNICFNLMPRTLEEFGLAKAVKEFCSHFLNAKATHFIIRQHGELPCLPAGLSIDLYRVVQEMVANAVKHGSASNIYISFSPGQRQLSIKVTDNGSGFNITGVQKGMGLKNVQSRVKSHNGKFYLQSSEGKGTRCRIVIPF